MWNRYYLVSSKKTIKQRVPSPQRTPEIIQAESVVQERLIEGLRKGIRHTLVWDKLQEEGSDITKSTFNRVRNKLYSVLAHKFRDDPVISFLQAFNNYDDIYFEIMQQISEVQYEISQADQFSHPGKQRVLGGLISKALRVLEAQGNLAKVTHSDVQMRVQNPEEINGILTKMLSTDISSDVSLWDYDKMTVKELAQVDSILNRIKAEDVTDVVVIDQEDPVVTDEDTDAPPLLPAHDKKEEISDSRDIADAIDKQLS